MSTNRSPENTTGRRAGVWVGEPHRQRHRVELRYDVECKARRIRIHAIAGRVCCAIGADEPQQAFVIGGAVEQVNVRQWDGRIEDDAADLARRRVAHQDLCNARALREPVEVPAPIAERVQDVADVGGERLRRVGGEVDALVHQPVVARNETL